MPSFDSNAKQKMLCHRRPSVKGEAGLGFFGFFTPQPDLFPSDLAKI